MIRGKSSLFYVLIKVGDKPSRLFPEQKQQELVYNGPHFREVEEFLEEGLEEGHLEVWQGPVLSSVMSVKRGVLFEADEMFTNYLKQTAMAMMKGG